MLFELQGQLGAAGFDNAAFEHDVHEIGLNVVEDALIVGNHHRAEIGAAQGIDARLLEVQTSFDRGKSNAGTTWSWILTLYDDHERFRAAHGEATPDKVIRFYVSDRDNLGSIVASIRAMRENARTLRSIIPTELWHQVTVFYHRFRDPTPSMLSDARHSQT